MKPTLLCVAARVLKDLPPLDKPGRRPLGERQGQTGGLRPQAQPLLIRRRER